MTVQEILLLPHTHHDVGYTDSPRRLSRQHVEIVGHVLDMLEADTRDDQAPDRMRWTFEVCRPVLDYVRQYGPSAAQRLARLQARGLISISAGYLNMTQLTATGETEHAYDMLQQLRDHGISIRTEQHGDVNGIAWGTAAAMRRAGVSRLVMALNPDHGRAPLTQPSVFRWHLPGKLAPVTVLLSTHYGVGEEWGILDGDTTHASACIEAFVSTLDKRSDWNFPFALVHAGNDNRWPDTRFLSVVEMWNRTHPNCPMRTVTIDDVMDHIESCIADGLTVPDLSGEWADWWAHGHGSTALEVTVHRRAREAALSSDYLRSLETLTCPIRTPATKQDKSASGTVRTATVLGYYRGPHRLRSQEELSEARAAIDRALLLYDEHTWGSWDSVSAPDSWNARSQHNAKASQAWKAWEVATDLAREALARALPDPPDTVLPALGSGQDPTTPRGHSLTVLNPSCFARRELVEDDRGYVAIADIPAYGRITVTPYTLDQGRPATHLRNSRYEITVDPSRGGITQLRDLFTGEDLLDPDAPPLGAIIDERFPPDSAHPLLADRKTFHPDHPGPSTQLHVLTGHDTAYIHHAAGISALRWQVGDRVLSAEVTLLVSQSDPDLTLTVHLNKQSRREPESIHVNFPFRVHGSARFLMETEGAVYEADREQLPNTARDWYSIQYALGVVGTDGRGMTLISHDAPLVQIGGVRTTAWSQHLPEHPAGTVTSWVMNNLYFTNFAAEQSGTTHFRYTLIPGKPTHSLVRRAGHAAAHPLITRRWWRPPLQGGRLPLCLDAVDSSGARRTHDVVAELEPCGSDRVQMVLRSSSDEDLQVHLTWASSTLHTLTLPSMGRETITLTAHGSIRS